MAALLNMILGRLESYTVKKYHIFFNSGLIRSHYLFSIPLRLKPKGDALSLLLFYLCLCFSFSRYGSGENGLIVEKRSARLCLRMYTTKCKINTSGDNSDCNNSPFSERPPAQSDSTQHKHPKAQSTHTSFLSDPTFQS